MPVRVTLRPVRPDDLRALLRMAVAFNDEDGHPLSIAVNNLARKLKIKALHLEAMPENERAARLYHRPGYRLSERRLMSTRY